MDLLWWQWTILGVLIYEFLGLLIAVAAFHNGKDDGDFWTLTILWPICVAMQMDEEVVPYFKKCRKQREIRRIKRTQEAFRSKYNEDPTE